MKYIFVDTNNLKFCALQIKEGNTPETLNKLKEIVSNNEEVKLLLPETVKLEYYRVVENSFIKDIKNKLGELKKCMNKDLKFGKHLKDPIKDKIEEIKLERKKSKEKALDIFNDIIELDNTIMIPLNGDILAEAEKRRIQKIKPSDGTYKKNQDCYIIEALIKYFDEIGDKNKSQLLFCTNDTDFLEKEEGTYKKLHEEIIIDLSIENTYYRLLPDMIEKEFDKEIDEHEKESIDNLDKLEQLDNFFNYIQLTSKRLKEIEDSMRIPEENLRQIQDSMTISDRTLKQIQDSMTISDRTLKQIQESMTISDELSRIEDRMQFSSEIYKELEKIIKRHEKSNSDRVEEDGQNEN